MARTSATPAAGGRRALLGAAIALPLAARPLPLDAATRAGANDPNLAQLCDALASTMALQDAADAGEAGPRDSAAAFEAWLSELGADYAELVEHLAGLPARSLSDAARKAVVSDHVLERLAKQGLAADPDDYGLAQSVLRDLIQIVQAGGA